MDYMKTMNTNIINENPQIPMQLSKGLEAMARIIDKEVDVYNTRDQNPTDIPAVPTAAQIAQQLQERGVTADYMANVLIPIVKDWNENVIGAIDDMGEMSLSALSRIQGEYRTQYIKSYAKDDYDKVTKIFINTEEIYALVKQFILNFDNGQYDRLELGIKHIKNKICENLLRLVEYDPHLPTESINKYYTDNFCPDVTSDFNNKKIIQNFIKTQESLKYKFSSIKHYVFSNKRETIKRTGTFAKTHYFKIHFVYILISKWAFWQHRTTIWDDHRDFTYNVFACFFFALCQTLIDPWVLAETLKGFAWAIIKILSVHPVVEGISRSKLGTVLSFFFNTIFADNYVAMMGGVYNPVTGKSGPGTYGGGASYVAGKFAEGGYLNRIISTISQILQVNQIVTFMQSAISGLCGGMIGIKENIIDTILRGDIGKNISLVYSLIKGETFKKAKNMADNICKVLLDNYVSKKLAEFMNMFISLFNKTAENVPFMPSLNKFGAEQFELTGKTMDAIAESQFSESISSLESKEGLISFIEDLAAQSTKILKSANELNKVSGNLCIASGRLYNMCSNTMLFVSQKCYDISYFISFYLSQIFKFTGLLTWAEFGFMAGDRIFLRPQTTEEIEAASKKLAEARGYKEWKDLKIPTFEYPDVQFDVGQRFDQFAIPETRPVQGDGRTPPVETGVPTHTRSETPPLRGRDEIEIDTFEPVQTVRRSARHRTPELEIPTYDHESPVDFAEDEPPRRSMRRRR